MSEQTAAKNDLPQVIVAQRVIDKIVRGAILYPEPETGEALVGLIMPPAERGQPDIFVLDTITPVDQVIREWGMFEQGDDWQGDVFHWLFMNWETFREMRRGSYGNAVAAKWDAPLRHVGDWHKQPGDMIAPSAGDAETALRMIADSETPVEHVVAPIVTLYPLEDEPSTPDHLNEEPVAPTGIQRDAVDVADSVGPDAALPVDQKDGSDLEEPVTPTVVANKPGYPLADNAIAVPVEDEGWLVRIDFWYMRKRARRFVPLKPVVWSDDRLPRLSTIPWHLAYPRRFDQELSLLADAGYTVDVVRWDADGKPPYEICFSVFKPGNQHVIILVTSADYPANMPAIRVSPLVSVDDGEDIFEKLYDASKSLLITQLPDWPWDSKRTLIELVWHVEKMLEESKT